MKKSISLLVMSLLSLCIALFLFTEVVAKEGEDVVVIRAAHQTAPGGFTDIAANKFKDLVETKSEGKIKVDMYPAGQLGATREILESLSIGNIDVLFEGLSWIAQYDKDLNFYNQSFMFEDPQELIGSIYQKEIIEKIRKNNGIRVLTYSAVMPAMQLWTKEKPVYTLDDLKGIKIRIPGVKAYVDIWNALGASAISIDWSETYMALAQNMVKGIVHDPVKIRDEHFYEHLKYCTLLDFKYSLSTIFISEKKYQSFSIDVQKILQESAREYADFYNMKIGEIENAAWDEMKQAGIEIIKVDREPWFKRAHQVHIQMEKDGIWSKGLLMKENKL